MAKYSYFVSIIVYFALFIFCTCINNAGVKNVSGNLIDASTNAPLAQITVKVVEYKSQLFNGTELGEAESAVSDSAGHFLVLFTPREQADAWLLQFISLEQIGGIPKYRDIAWYKDESQMYKLFNQLN